MRWHGRTKLGYFPLALAEAERIRRYLTFPSGSFTGLDPCIGDGGAFATITTQAAGYRYGIELDAYRAEQARSAADEVIQGNCFEVQCPVESLSLLYLNPPYDFEIAEAGCHRMEQLFLQHCFRWLKPAGVLVLVIPGGRLAECSSVLAGHFRDTRTYRLTEPESVRYKQVVLFGVRRNRRERDRLADVDITQARLQYGSISRNAAGLPALSSQPDCQYVLPEGGPIRLIYRGLPLDQIEDALVKSSAYRHAAPILFGAEARVTDRPLTPLHSGHVGVLCTAGLLNGVFGEGEGRHIGHWQSLKVVDRSEEEEDGVVTIREKERFTHSLTLVFEDGRTAILS